MAFVENKTVRKFGYNTETVSHINDPPWYNMGCSNSKDLFIHTNITSVNHSPTASQENSPATATTATANDFGNLNFQPPNRNNKNVFVSILDEENNNSNSEKSIEVCCSYQIQFKDCTRDKDDVVIHHHNPHGNVNNTEQEKETERKDDFDTETNPLTSSSSSSSETMEIDPILQARSLSTTQSTTQDYTEETLDGISGPNLNRDQNETDHPYLPCDTRINHKKNLRQDHDNIISNNNNNNDPKIMSNKNIIVKAIDNNKNESNKENKVINNSSSSTSTRSKSTQASKPEFGSNMTIVNKPDKTIQQSSEVITIQIMKDKEEEPKMIISEYESSRQCDTQKMIPTKQQEDEKPNPPSTNEIVKNSVTREDVHKLGEMSMEQKVQNFLEQNSRGDFMSSAVDNHNTMVPLSPQMRKKGINHHNQSYPLNEDGLHFLMNQEKDEKKDAHDPEPFENSRNETNGISSSLQLESPYRERRQRIKKQMEEEDPIEKQMMSLIQTIEKEQQSVRQQHLKCENDTQLIYNHQDKCNLLHDNHHQNSLNSLIRNVPRKNSNKIHRDAKKHHSQALLMAQRLQYLQKS